MTQFASTLYPQTNPTNPILLSFRSEVDWANITDDGKHAEISDWLYWLTEELGDSVQLPRKLRVAHAIRVLERLAALTG